MRCAAFSASALLSTLLVTGLAADAHAQARSNAQPRGAAQASAASPGGGQAVGAYGDWAVYVAKTGRSKVCYALAHPKARLPKGLNRDPGYLFVSARPAEGVRNEIAWVLGFNAKPNQDGEVVIDGASQPVVTRGSGAWLKDPSQEGQTVAAMARGSRLVIKVQSQRGNNTSDEYSLKGFTQAMERVRKECAS
ncbi:invasion associated locus B family protein [Camelimonas abortus]|uniref:Invasion associated locus B family protein n=1 Tax=Camelimonas abortus TaxID=1017184 RepID=A0ABV7LCB5_9HYPH